MKTTKPTGPAKIYRSCRLITIAIVIVIGAFFYGCTNQPEVKYLLQNPVLPGDRPNPSVVKIGESYYASTTSNKWSPLFPIFKSDDLENWELISYVFPSGAPDWAVTNFWSPELSFDEKQNKLFVYYTGRDKTTNKECVALASADTPEGPFVDHGPIVSQGNGSIDAFEIRDEKDVLFVIWKEVPSDANPRSLIWAQKINENRDSLLGEKHLLIKSDQEWEKISIEGPSLFRVGDFFYMYYSAGDCCDEFCNYKIGVARSKSLLGPWEKYKMNPILNDNMDWKCPGTGTVVKKGNDLFLLYHAYSSKEGIYIGREGVLEKIVWSDDDWPLFENNQIENRKINKINFEDYFKGALNPKWKWRDSQNLSYATGDYGLMLSASNENELLGSLLVQDIKSTEFELTTCIDLSKTGECASGGIALIGAINNKFGAPVAGLGISVDHEHVTVWKNCNQQTIIYHEKNIPNDREVELKIEVKKGHILSFYVFDGQIWELLSDNIDASPLVPWGMGFRFGIVAKGDPSEFVNIRNIKLNNK